MLSAPLPGTSKTNGFFFPTRPLAEWDAAVEE